VLTRFRAALRCGLSGSKQDSGAVIQTTPMRVTTIRLSMIAGMLALSLVPAHAQFTESPETMTPGRLRVRMDAITVGFEREDLPKDAFTALALATTVVSAGLSQNLDIEAGAQLYHRETYALSGARHSNSGLGDLRLRMKWRFWTNDQGTAAAAVIPYVKFPTGSSAVGNNAVEGGFMLPWALSAPAGLDAGTMFRWDFVRNDADDGYDSQWLVSGVVGRRLTSRFGVYGESVISVSSNKGSSWEGTIGVGATFDASNSLQWDYSMTRGLNARATDWTHVLRLRWTI
jgi:hypothetical protein